jgi:Mrp family chromosome partitioning ATPase/capsular polysaccharide biosynthesis protein
VTNGNGGNGSGVVMSSGPGGSPPAGYAPGPPPQYPGEPEREGLTLRDYVAVITRRWWIIVLVVVVATASAYYFSYRQPKQYSADATIIYKQQLDLANPLNGSSTDAVGLDREMASINDLLASPKMQTRTRANLADARVSTSAKYTVTAEQHANATGANGVASTSNVVVFTGDSTSPALAAAGANAAAHAFVDWNAQLQVDQISKAIPVLEGQLADYQTPASKLSTDYIMLKQRLQDLQILKATAKGNYQILAPASVPLEPYAPNPLRSAILGLGVGLFAGIGLAFLLEQFDTRVRKPDDIAAALHQPILGRIPRISSKLLGDSALVTMRHPEGPVAEAFRMVRTNLEFMAVDNEIRSMLVTSCMKGEGKSVAVANLAISMALAGKKVVVVDADMRRPRQHKLFGLENERGLSTVATGRDDLMKSMVRVDVSPVQDGVGAAKAAANGADFSAWAHGPEALSRIYVLPSGPIPPNPGEIVASRRFQAIIESLESEADLVIVDTPAMLAVGDTSTIAGAVDGAIFLVDLKRIKKPQLYTAADQLFRLPVKMLGAVVRMYGTRSSHYYYSPNYYYRYSYAEDGQKQKEKRRQAKPSALQ